MGKYLFLINLLLLSEVFIFAQYIGNTSYKNIQFEKVVSNGNLSFVTIESIAQDKYGFIWIGTRQGLVRYDGYNYKLYVHNKSDSTSISSNDIWDIIEDKKGNLWIGTTYGVNIYNREKDNFSVLRIFDDLESQEVFIESIICFGNYIYIALERGLIYIYDTELMQKIAVYDDNFKGYKKDYLRDIMMDRDSTLWVATENNGVLFLGYGQKEFKHLPKSFYESISYSTKSIFQDRDGFIWIGTNNGLAKYNKYTGDSKIFVTDANDPHSISNIDIWKINGDVDGNMWICTDNGGLILYIPKTENFYTYNQKTYPIHFFDALAIRVTYSDQANNLWVGTFNQGLYFVDGNKKKFATVQYKKEAPDILNHSSVNFLIPDEKNHVWIGSDGGGINYFDLENRMGKTFIHEEKNPHSLPGNKAITGIIGNNNELWMGMWAGGLAKLDMQTMQFDELFPKALQKTNDYNVWCLLKDNETLFVGTFNGLYTYNLTSKKFHKFTMEGNPNTGTSSPRIWSLTKCSDSLIYIGTSDGLNVFNQTENKFKYYGVNNDDPFAITDHNIMCLAEDQKKRIWIGTVSQGLCFFNRSNQTFHRVPALEQVTDNIINSIVVDDRGLLWIGTTNGLIQYNPDTEKANVFYESDGLFGNKCNPGCINKDLRGNIFVGGANGFSYFHPDSITKNNFQPYIVFTDFTLFNKPVDINRPGSPLSKDINLTETLYLKYYHNIFSIEFASLNYSNPENNLYQYYLEGLENGWNEPSKKRHITYTNLDPGKYVLRVRASNNDGVWSKHERALNIVVSSPFWETWWFISLCSCIITVGAVLFYFIRINQIEKQKKYLEELVSQRTEELVKTDEERKKSYDKVIEQMKMLREQKDQIALQHKELEQHRSHLEELVKSRTHYLNTAKNRAVQADKLKTSFLANMSHEIRTPMTGIMGFLNLIETRPVTDEKRKLYFEYIYQNAHFLLNLIDNIIDYSRIESNDLAFNFEKIRLKELNESIMNSPIVHSKKSKPALSFNFSCSITDDFELNIDGARLKQVVEQLIENAIKYTEQGEIKVECALLENNVIFTIADTGIGIEDEHKDKIFDGFYKIENKSNMLYRGTGIGLAISKYIIKQFKGKIWLDHSAPGEGTVFKISIPSKRVEMV